jgi:predicted anti-sigma-YlaC factor YlaD
MRCEEVRDRLPGYLDRDLRAVGALEIHLASCRACRGELQEYRRLRALLSEMADGPEPSPRLLHDLLSGLPVAPIRARSHAGTRARYALASLGGAAVGATALALVWWRVARRPAGDVESAREAV